MSTSRISAAIVAALLWALPAQAHTDALRAEFRAALKLAQSGSARAHETADSEALRTYVLYPYLLAARVKTALALRSGEETDARVADFLKAHAELPVAHEIRRDWLLNLAGRGQWGAFLAAYDPDRADAALRCHQLQAWIETGGGSDASGELKTELLQIWTTGELMPQACVAPFQWLKEQGVLTAERYEERARLALKAGNADLAEWLIRAVPAPRAAPLNRWLRLLRDPQREIPALIAQPRTPVEDDALEDAWATLARTRPDAALPLLTPLIQARPPDAQLAGVLRRDLALGLAWDRRAEALEHFRRTPESALDERAYEWRARAALWNRQWEQAGEWLHAMPPALSAEPRWAYFRARALEQLGRAAQSRTIYRTLAQENGYFSVLSAWRLQQEYEPRTRSLPYDAALQQQLLQLPALVRARELFLVGRADWANHEWRVAMHGLDTAAKVQAARLASSWGWHVQAVQMLSNAGVPHDLELLYPREHEGQLKAAARWAGVPEEWVYGVMRQESTFLTTAVSPSQAYGLLQLLLPTARHVARKWQRPIPERDDLFSPEVNIPLGTAYLRDMADRFDGQFPLVMAAYNAGPNAAARWLPDAPLDADIWIDNIPYNQTRAYVGKVMWHIAVHRWRLTGEAQDVSPLLRPVARPAS